MCRRGGTGVGESYLQETAIWRGRGLYVGWEGYLQEERGRCRRGLSAGVEDMCRLRRICEEGERYV